MATFERRINDLEKRLNITDEIQVIQGISTDGGLEYLNVNTGEITPKQPNGSEILAKVEIRLSDL